MTIDEYFSELCRRMGWEPTPWRIEVFKFWARQEGMPFAETWNPLATTRTGPLNAAFNNGNGPGNWNSVPVRVYANAGAGITATFETLQLSFYVNVRRCFEDQVGYDEAIRPHDFTSWVGSDEYGRRVVNFMKSCTESKVAISNPLADVLKRLENIEKLLGGRENIATQVAPERGNDLWAGFVLLQKTVAELGTKVAGQTPPAQASAPATPASAGGAASLEGETVAAPPPARRARKKPASG